MTDEAVRNDVGIVWRRALRSRLERRRFLRYTAVGAGALGLGALGCSGGGGSEIPRAAPVADATKTPKSGGILKLLATGDPPDYDPQVSNNINSQLIFSVVSHRLIKLEKGLDIAPMQIKIGPDLAEKWEQADEKTYIFTLRQGVKWQDVPPANGREVVANDIVVTYRRFVENPAFPMAWLFSDLERVEARDNYTVVFRLKEPSASFLLNLAWQFSAVINPEALAKEGNLRKHPPVGMGPFLFERHDRNLMLTYKRNPNWFKKPLPYVDEVRYLIIPDATASQAAFLSGEIDEYEARNKEDAENILKTFKNAKYESHMVNSWRAPILNTRRPPLGDKRVRRAISLAIDRKAIISALAPGEGKVQGIIPSYMVDYKLPDDELEKLYKMDVPEAKRLLAEAGFPNGFQIAVTSTNGYGQLNVDESEMFVASLKAAGIDAQLKMLDYATFQKAKSDRNFDIMFGAYTRYLEPGQLLEGHYLTGGGRNESGISDPKFDDMIKQQKRALNQAERKKIIGDIERYAAQELNAIPPVVAFTTHQLWNPRLIGHRFHPDYGHKIGEIWLDS